MLTSVLDAGFPSVQYAGKGGMISGRVESRSTKVQIPTAISTQTGLRPAETAPQPAALLQHA